MQRSFHLLYRRVTGLVSTAHDASQLYGLGLFLSSVRRRYRANNRISLGALKLVNGIRASGSNSVRVRHRRRE